jgi:altronate hydrolase
MISGPPRVLRVHDNDDVAVTLEAIESGATLALDSQPLIVTNDIPKGHKIALRNFAAGDSVRKYGHIIGRTNCKVSRGEWLHEHNIESMLTGFVTDNVLLPQPLPAATNSFATGPSAGFMGYRRADGRVGTRNEIWILATVGCVAKTVERIAREAARRWPTEVDGIYAFPHPFGCSQLGSDLDGTRQVLASLACHPNAGGVLIVGLGCESNQLGPLLQNLGDADRHRIRSFNAQQQTDEFEAGVAAVGELVAIAATDRREQCSLAELRIGLKCGGSDAFSGLTANPLVGRIADAVTTAGGSAILTEVPELFGAESLLVQRSADQATASAFVELINRFRHYYVDQGEPLEANPSPGNRAGGISTLEEKSLGAAQKAGAARLTHVIGYGQRSTASGLGVLEAPGNDAVSSTALVAAGATIVLFTTGRGTPLGAPAPTLKIASNSALARAKPTWIDFDAGVLLAGQDAASTAHELLELVLATASGRPARNELNDERSIAIWKRGVTL